MRHLIAIILSFVSGILFAGFLFWVLDITWQRRFVIYNIRNQVYKGMPRSEVDEIVRKNLAFRVLIPDGADDHKLSVVAPVGVFADAVFLNLTFVDHRLATAIVVGEDNPFDVPVDAPPNIY